MDKQKLFEELLRKKGIVSPQGPVLTRRDDPAPYQLSFAQRRIWFLQQFDPQSAAYNDPEAIRIKGPLNMAVMERCFNEIIRRHRVMRMTFPAREGQPVMVPHPDEGIELSVTALQLEPGASLEDRVLNFVNRFSSRPFDLATDLLVRVGVLKIGEADYALVMNVHHIVMDGWSKGLMLQELMDIYPAYSKGLPSPLKEPAIQYTDYVHWHRQWVQGKLYESQLSYWREQLAGAPPVLALPTDHPRPQIPSGRGSLEPFSLSTEKYKALNNLARAEDATLFMVLMAALNTLLFRCCGQEDILIGTPIAGRHRLELEQLIGLFVNTLVIRTDLTGEPGFKELLRRVRKTALEAYANQDMPFEKLVEELNPQRNLSVTPLFQVLFQLQNAPMPPARIAGLTITPIQVDAGFSQVDLSLTMWEDEGIMKGTFEYSTDLFETSAILRMIGHFQTLLDGIIDDENQKISRLPMLTEGEARQLLKEWNDTDCDYPAAACIYQLFETTGEKHGHEVAVIFDKGQMTYSELNRQANQLARYLQRFGVKAESLAAICLDNCLELVVGIMAILKAGGGYIPMDPGYPDQRLQAILWEASPSVLLTQAGYLSRFPAYDGHILCIDRDWELVAGEDRDNKANLCRPISPGCVIYTSGSTGEPRGILIENSSIVNLIFSFIRSYSPGPADRILPLTSIASASFVGEVLPMLSCGGGVVLADKIHFLDMKKLASLLNDYEISILSTVPSMIARLNAVNWQPTKLRLLLSGGEALSAGDVDHLPGSLCIVNGYGLTEATICSTYNVLDGAELSKNPLISVGRPVINTQIYIVDRTMNIVPIGVAGEIYIGGVGLARGYLNNPELTAERFLNAAAKSREDTRSSPHQPLTPKSVKNPIIPLFQHSIIPEFKRSGSKLYRTGDLGSWLPNGTIKFLGRIDTQVQVHGHRIELSEIENHLGLHPGVADVVVLDREIGAGDKRLVAYLVTENGHMLNTSELRGWLDERLPDYMIPGVFEIVDAIPLTPNGKVDVDALPIPSGLRPELEVEFKAPRSQIEQSIASVWQELLHVQKVGINDNFFDLGGHSLLLTQVHSRLGDMYDKELTIVDLFRFPTIHSLAKFLGDNRKQEISDNYQKIRERANKQRQVYQSRSK
jgi:amino acid adenylation domain-containing protein